MLSLLNNPLFSDLTLYISNAETKKGESKNNSAQSTRDNDARPIHLHKCIVFSRFPDFPRYFMGGNAELTEIDLHGYSFDAIENAMQILYRYSRFFFCFSSFLFFVFCFLFLTY
jgi:hypothetical protein